MRLLRLMGAIVSLSLRRGLAFRTNLAFEVAAIALDLAAGVVTLWVVYSQTDDLGGWGAAEAVVLLGSYQIVSGLLWAFVEPNVVWFGNQIIAGKLDDTLLKPVPSLFMASLGSCNPLWLVQSLLGGVILVAGVFSLDPMPNAAEWGGWAWLLAAALVLTWATRVLVATVTFWAPAFAPDVLYGSAWQFGRYPVSLYRQPVRFLLTWVFPIGFIATLPAQALTRGVGLPVLLGGVVVAGIAFAITRFVWQAGLRRYTSATS
jgi:ABC-2 type transport system permease protein